MSRHSPAFVLLPLLCLSLAAAGGGTDRSDGQRLFDGQSLAGWKVANFGGEGEVAVEDGAIVLHRGDSMTGITYAGKDFPRINYEVTLQARRLQGNDFFCTTTFPVGAAHCSLVVGGWGGTVVGLSSLDGRDAVRNETTTYQSFQARQWYQVRLRVADKRITAWIDSKKVVDVNTEGKKITIRPECELCRPFGIATWNTVGAVRDIRIRPLTEAERRAAKTGP